jgi:hypothetical protein
VRYDFVMSQPHDVPPGREQLVQELAELPESERHAVVAAAEQAARGRRGPVVSWKSLRAAKGVMNGAPADAVEDSVRLYDG